MQNSNAPGSIAEQHGLTGAVIQVKGLQAAYTKILDEQPGAGKGSSAPSSTSQADSTRLKVL